MSITTDTNSLVRKRVTMLTDIGNSLGLRHMPVLDEEQQQLFNLGSSDPLELVENFEFMRSVLTWSDELEAAYYVLGIDAGDIDDSRRRGALFTRLGMRGDVLDMMRLRPQEAQGFTALATSYDLMMNLRKFILEKSASPINVRELSEALDVKQVEASRLNS